MGYYNDDGEWMEGGAPPTAPRRMPRQMRPAEERQHDPNPGVRQQARRQMRQGYYDDDGNFVEGAPANLGETLDDVRRSFGTGVERGISGMLGTVGSIDDMLDASVRAGARLSGRSEEEAERIQGAFSQVTDPVVAGTLTAVGGPVGLNMALAPRIFPNVEQTTEMVDALVPGEHHEPETTAGEYARTAGEWAPNFAAPGGAIRRGAQALPSIASNIATRTSRVVVPSAASETAGQLTEGTDAEPYARFLAGLGAAGVTEGFLAVLRRQGLTADERALRLMMRELEDQGMTPEEVVRQANVLTRQAPTEEVLAEVLGPGGQRMARAVAAMGRGRGRSIADEALTTRAEGGRAPDPIPSAPNRTRPVQSIRDRIMDETSEMTAPQQTRSPRNYWDALDALRRARSGQSATAYNTAYGAQPDPQAVQGVLLPYMETAPRGAFVSAERQLASVADALRARLARATQNNATQEIAALQSELDDVITSRNQLSSLARGERPNGLNTRSIDYFARGLSQLESTAGMGSPEARAIGESRRAFNQMVDDGIVPELGQARQHYGASMRVEENMNTGRRVFEMTDGEIERAMRGANGAGLTMEEFDGFMLGVLDAIERKLGQSDTAFLARLSRNQNWRDQITRAVGGEANARRFFSRLAREANMQKTRNFVQSGSRTTPLADDIKALTEGEAELAFLSDEMRGVVNAGMRGADMRTAAIRLATWVYDRVSRPGIANPQVQEAMARRLFARATRTNARELRDALNALRADQSIDPTLRQWLARVTAANEAFSEEEEGSVSEEYINLRQQAQGDGERY